MFFMSGNVEMGLNANSVSAPKKHFVAVRFTWSSLAYHVALEKIEFEILKPYINLWENGGPLEPLLPSKAVFLNVTREERIRRLHGRGDYESQGELASSDSFDSIFKHLDEAYASILSLWHLAASLRPGLAPGKVHGAAGGARPAGRGQG